MIPEAQDLDPSLPEQLRASLIPSFCLRLGMAAAVDLDRQLRGGAVEIEDEATDLVQAAWILRARTAPSP